MIRKQRSPHPNKLRIVFELPSSLWADRVWLAADFNNWNPAATPLQQDRSGAWRTAVDLPVGRRYEFRYLIDGHWSTDCHADDSCPNGAGSHNSVVLTTPILAA